MKKVFLTAAGLFTVTVLGFGQGQTKIVDGKFNERVGASAGAGFAVMLSTVGTASGVFFTDGTTTISGTNYDMQLLYCVNSSAGTASLTALDSSGTHTYVPGVAIPPNTVVGIYANPLGLRLLGGLQLIASTAGAIGCQVQGVVKGVGG